MAEHWTCIECESLFDASDGDLDERMCNKCINRIYDKEKKYVRISDINKEIAKEWGKK
jgi:hypothetical protein